MYNFFDYSVSGNATSGNYTVGVNYKLTPTIVADVFGGVVVTNVDEPKSTNTGYTGGISFTKTFEQKGTAVLSFVQNVIAGLESTTPIRQQTATLSYNAPVTSKLDATISVYYSIYRPIGSTGTIGTDNDRNDAGGTAQLSYRLLPWLNAFVSYSYVNSDNKTNDTGSYNNNLVMAGVKLAKQYKF